MRSSLLFIAAFSFSLFFNHAASAQNKPPIVPDPFCAPSEFFKYLNSRNQARVLHVVQKCTNIDLKELGPKGEAFSLILATTNWDDVFEAALNRKDANFQVALKQLIISQKFQWLKKLATQNDLTFGVQERTEISKTFPKSEEFLLQLLELKKLDVNSLNADRHSMLFEALESVRFDLVQFLRSRPEVDQTNFHAHACAYQNARRSDSERKAYREYFKILFQNEKININLVCADGNPLAYHLLQPEIDPVLINAVLKSSQLDLSKPTISYRVANTLIQNFATLKDQYFDSVLSNPTFNFNDRSPSKDSFWHLLARLPEQLWQTSFIRYFDSLSDDSINEPNGSNLSPLYFLVTRREVQIDDVVSKKFFSAPKIDLNRLDAGATAIVIAMQRRKLDLFNYLLARGVDTIKVGNVKILNSALLFHMPEHEVYFKTFFNHPEIDINKKIEYYFDSRSYNVSFFGLVIEKRSSLRHLLLPVIMKDSRFNKNQVETYRLQLRYKSCTAILAWLEYQSNEPVIAKLIAENSSDENLKLSCSNESALTLASKRGNLELAQYLYEFRKMPVVNSNKVSAFANAYRSRQWPVVEYFVSKGYAAEFNADFVQYLLADKQSQLLKKVVMHPDFDPNMPLERDKFLLAETASIEYQEIFDLILNHPKTKIGKKLIPLITWPGDQEILPFLEAALNKFKIETAEDKEAAINACIRFADAGWPVAYFIRITKLKNFDINYQTKGHYSDGQYTLYSFLLGDLQGEALDVVRAIKNFDPLTPSDIDGIEGLIYNHQREKFVEIKKQFDAHYAHPKIKAVLPNLRGEPFFKAFADCNYDYYRTCPAFLAASLFLGHPKFKFSNEELNQFFNQKKNFNNRAYDSNYRFEFLNAFFANSVAKPLARWSSIISDLDFYSSDKEDTEAVQFIKQFGKDLDLNYKADPKDPSLLEISIDEESEPLFLYLLSNPKVSVAGALEQMIDSWRFEETHLQTLIEKRGRDILQVELLSQLVSYSRHPSEDGKVSAEVLRVIQLLFPLIKSFDKFTELSQNYAPAPIYYYMIGHKSDPVIFEIYNRILAEDTTLATNTQKVILYLFQHSRFDLLDHYIKRGYNIVSDIERAPILALVTEFKSLQALQYLISKGKSGLMRCQQTTWCEGETAFGRAVKLEWFEGADYLLANGADPRSQDFANATTILAAVKRKRASAVRYLLGKNVTVNEWGVLVQALMDQSDEIVALLLSVKDIDPNVRGYDAATKDRLTYPIIEAARFGRLDYVKALLQIPKIQKDVKDGLGFRAIDWAATNNYQEIVELLKN